MIMKRKKPLLDDERAMLRAVNGNTGPCFEITESWKLERKAEKIPREKKEDLHVIYLRGFNATQKSKPVQTTPHAQEAARPTNSSRIRNEAVEFRRLGS